jgi:hypothetical protein
MYRTFIVAVLAAGCGAGLEDGSTDSIQSALCAAGDTLVCHDGAELCVGRNAVAAHASHGDFEGPCFDIGTPPIAPEDAAWTPQQPTAPQQLADSLEAQAIARATQALDAPPPWSPQQPKAPAEVAEAPSTQPTDWTAQVPQAPASLCVADEGHACGGSFGACCDGLRCAWGVCLIDG